MLELMRKNASSWVIKFLLGIIVLVFVFLGIGSQGSRYDGVAAVVNGDNITVDEYRDAYQRIVEQFRQRFGNSLNDELIKMFKVEEQAIQGLIDQKLLLQESLALKVRVSDEELGEFIQKIGVFQNNGAFDGQRYESLLRQNRLTPAVFENQQRELLVADKLRGLVAGGVKVGEREASEWFRWNDASVNIDYVVFTPARYKDVKVSEEEVLAFYKENADSYKTDPMIRSNYLRFDPSAYVSEVEISAEEIKEYYESSPEEFETPKTVEARHILIKVDQEADEKTVTAAKERADAVYEQAAGGEDFAELAQKHSEGPTRESGGKLGAFRREAMVKPFADKAFSMEAGQVGEPVRTRFGWHIIKVEKVNPASLLTLAEAGGKIEKKLKDEAAQNLAYDDAEAVSDSLADGDTLEEVAKARGLVLESTELFARQGPVKGVADGSQFSAVAFALADGEISDVQDLAGGYYILQTAEKIPSVVPELSSVRATVEADLAVRMQDEKASQAAGKFLEAVRGGKTLLEESNNAGLEIGTTGFFKRTGAIPEIGVSREISEAVFKLSDENRFPGAALKAQKGYYVVSFKERKEPDAEAFEKEKTDITARLLQQKRAKAFGDWLAGIREKSEIRTFIN